MIRKHKIRAVSFVFCIVAFGMVIIALRPVLRMTKLLASSDRTKTVKTNTFDEVDITIYDAKDRKVDVSASQASIKKDNATLDKMTSSFTLSNGEKCEISSDSANTLSKELIEFKGNVQLKTGSGLSLSTNQVVVDLEQKSAAGKSYIEVSKGNNHLSGDGYRINLDKKYLTLSRNAKVHNDSANIEANQLEATLNENNKLGNVQASGNVKCYSKKHSITATRVSFNNNKLEMKGNVQITDLTKNERIRGNSAVFFLNNANKVTSAEIIGNSEYSSRNYKLKAKNIRYNNVLLQAKGNVYFDYQKNGQKYNIVSDSLTAKIINRKISQVKTDDKLTIKTNHDTIKANSCVMRGNKLFLHGDVSAKSEIGNIFGDRAELNLATGEVTVGNCSGVIEEGRNAKRNSL